MTEQDLKVELERLRGIFNEHRSVNRVEHKAMDERMAHVEERMTTSEKAVVQIVNRLDLEAAADAAPLKWLSKIKEWAVVIVGIAMLGAWGYSFLTSPKPEEVAKITAAALKAELDKP